MKQGERWDFRRGFAVEMSPIWEFASDESTEEGVDVGNLNIGGGQSLTMSVVRVEEELFEHFAGEVRVDSDETAGIRGGGMLKQFGEVLILGG